MMLLMSQQTKHGDLQLVFTSDVMNIAEFLLIFGIETMPLPHLMVQALSQFRFRESHLDQKDLKSIIRALSSDSMQGRTFTKTIPKSKISPMAMSSTNDKESDSESDSDNDRTEGELRKDRSQAVKVPTDEQNLELERRLRASIASNNKQNKINEAEMLATMVERISYHLLDCIFFENGPQ